MHQKKVMLSLQNILKKTRRGIYEKHRYNVIIMIYLRQKDLEKGRLQ